MVPGKARHQSSPEPRPDSGQPGPGRGDVFVDELDLATLGFVRPAATGRPGYSPNEEAQDLSLGWILPARPKGRFRRIAVTAL
jgi:hypothetical protein